MVIERRKDDGRERVNSANCFCRINLGNGVIDLMGRIIDISENGIRIEIAYRPSCHDVIALVPSLDMLNSTSEHIKVFVKWCGVDLANCGKNVWEVGCEIQDQGVNLKEKILNSY